MVLSSNTMLPKYSGTNFSVMTILLSFDLKLYIKGV